MSNLKNLQKSVMSAPQFAQIVHFWMVLAALWVVGGDQKLVSMLNEHKSTGSDTATTTKYCDNHEDGVTEAAYHCATCQKSLCADCDRFLHLARSQRAHERTVIVADTLTVDVHEGCIRAKLSILFIIIDVDRLRAVVQSRQEQGGTKCRFCGTVLQGDEPPNLGAVGPVCAAQTCKDRAQQACPKVHMCGHTCYGVRNEKECLPCLHGCDPQPSVKRTQDHDDFCLVCYSESLAEAPSIQLGCGHIFHHHCIKTILERKWLGARITFGFAGCPICKVKISHPMLKEYTNPIWDLYEEVKRKATLRLGYMGLDRCDDITVAGRPFHNKPEDYAMDRFAYYLCNKCKKPYFGGEKQCAVAAPENFDPEELICGGCAPGAAEQNCPKHGRDYLEYKCRYCCSIAIWFCFGTTHFCEECHSAFSELQDREKDSLPQCPVGPRAVKLDVEKCPLGIDHPPTGEEFALGCGICRNARMF